MIEVIINGTGIDLISKGVKYTRQVNDLADISTVNASYTYALKVPKTPINTRVFRTLGMVGDTSNFPYHKNTAQLIDNGAVLIEKGWVTVKETSSEYNLFIQDGIIDVFKFLENKSLGLDLDLSELEHSKTAETIISSWEGLTPYKYLIADYNGKTQDALGIDVQYQIPSVNAKYLWDKVFDFMGYTYSGNFDFLDNKYITYPKPPEIENSEEVRSFLGIKTVYSGPYNDSYKQWTWTSPNPLEDVTVLNSGGYTWKLRINQTGSYKIDFHGTGTMDYFLKAHAFGMGTVTELFRMNIYINGEFENYVLSNTGIETGKYIEKTLQADDEIELIITPIEEEDLTTENNYIRTAIASKNYSITNLTIESLTLELLSTGRENIDFRTALSEFSLRDFFKEVMFRGALTPFADNIKRHIEFICLKDRLNTSKENVIDLSSKYVGRVKETYTFGTYAQKNLLTLRYNTVDDNYHNSSIYVENRNIEEKKILFASKFYAPEKEQTEISFTSTSTGKTPVIKLWEKENKEDAEGNQVIEYKPLNNRFYFLTGKAEPGPITINGINATGFISASITGTTMPEVNRSKYRETDKIFTDTRIQGIELLLSAYDFQSIDFRKLHYFEQEGQFYILNRLIWESGKVSTGEFLRVKKV